MGSFYTSHTLRGPSQAAVVAELNGRSAYVSASEHGCVTVLDEACESQDGEELASLAARLSAVFQCPVLAVLNHDDDILYFELYEAGEQRDEYNSSPSYFDDTVEDDGPSGGNPALLAAAFGVTDKERIEAALRSTEYVFATERHHELALALSLPSFSVGIGYTYASAGELPPGVPKDVFTHTDG